ncbi:MAG: GHMP kinase [Planctomycetes bacterium]|nr:GHMP kinase [Planctomycetota bacterium]
MIIRKRAYPRIGLIGNPSDGYYGKTIAFTFSNFFAEVVLYQSPELEIIPCSRDNSCFSSVPALVEDVGRVGYYGGIRLLKASIKCFYDYCQKTGILLDDRNFTIRYSSTIPHHVGLAGSSAIITACFRALMDFYHISIPKPILANIILSVECEELNISAGLQDRVAQVYEGLVYMDFDKKLMAKQGYGKYVPLDRKLLPNIYMAYRTESAKCSEIFHNNIRERFERGETKIVQAMKYWAGLADKVRNCLLHGEVDKIGEYLNENFDRRAQLYHLPEDNLRMVQIARKAGVSAKFTGSGGAIVGIYKNEKVFQRFRQAAKKDGIKVIKPHIVGNSYGSNGD